MAGCCASNEPVHNAGIIGAAPEERGDRGGSESAELPPSVTCQGCVRPGRGDGDGRLVSRTGTQTGLASGTGVAQRRGSTAGLPRCRPAGLWGAFYRTNLGLTRGAPWGDTRGILRGRDRRSRNPKQPVAEWAQTPWHSGQGAKAVSKARL